MKITLLLLSITALVSHAKKPNFVIIFNDDMGYADLGCFGADKIKTPRVDQMAKEGRKFTSFYVASVAVCSASQRPVYASLLLLVSHRMLMTIWAMRVG